MTRPDWLEFAAAAFFVAFVGLFWAGIICFALWPFAAGMLDTIGKLNGCEDFPTECTAYAEGGK